MKPPCSPSSAARAALALIGWVAVVTALTWPLASVAFTHLVFGPVFVLSHDPVLALNVLFIGGSALTAWTIGLVAARWTRSVAAGAVAGATYLATPWALYEWVPRCPHFAMLMSRP